MAITVVVVFCPNASCIHVSVNTVYTTYVCASMCPLREQKDIYFPAKAFELIRGYLQLKLYFKIMIRFISSGPREGAFKTCPENL